MGGKEKQRGQKAGTLAYGEDENKERGNWTGKADFLLSTIGFAVGLGNIWRFPFKAYSNGGASFLVPYIVFLITAGLPMFFLELSFGQFGSEGPITLWKAMPFFKGLGWAMAIISALVCIYYNMIIAYTLYYLFASMNKEVPWQHCWEGWLRVNRTGSLYTCIERNANYSMIRTAKEVWCNMTRDTGPTNTLEYLYNCTATPMTSAHMYWEEEVLDISEGIDDGDTEFNWKLVLALLGAWIIVFFCMCKGVKSSGKVVYFTALFPYAVLIILCIRNAFLDGALKGILFYVKPDVAKLVDPSVWYSAAIQIFYSLGIAFGGLQTMASYNRFHNNIYRDALLVAIINCGTSIFAGFVIFSVIGYMSEITGLDVDKVAQSGPGLAFVAYPEGIATMPVAPLWAILFFLMILTLGLDSQFAMMETVITSLADAFGLHKKHKHAKTILTLVLCIVLFLLGLPQCTRAGVYVMNLFDWYSAGYSLIIVSLCEVIALSWIYDFRQMKEDVQMMVGTGCWINASFYYYWFPTWVVITPGMLAFIFIYMCISYSPAVYDGKYEYPAWADGMGWLMVALATVCIPVAAIIEYCRPRGYIMTWKQMFRPLPDWGPVVPEYRTGRYSQGADNPGFVTDDGGPYARNGDYGAPSKGEIEDGGYGSPSNGDLGKYDAYDYRNEPPPEYEASTRL